MLNTLLRSQKSQFIKRWPKSPKIVFTGLPNSFQQELSQRLAIDLGVPLVSMQTILSNI